MEENTTPVEANNSGEPEIIIEPVKKPGLLTVFIPTQNYFITPLIIWANIIVFLLMVITGVSFINPSTEDMLNWGANYRMFTLDGQPWRLLTSCFLHYGIIHIAFNMYAFVSAGRALEELIGKWKFLIVYLAAGISGSAASIWWSDNTVSGGASGAIFGVYGAFGAILSTNFRSAERKELLKRVGTFIAYNIVLGLGIGIVDNAAHIGGLLGGVIGGYLSYLAIKSSKAITGNLFMSAYLVLIFAFVATIYFKTPNHFGQYTKYMEEIEQLEKQALRVYNLNPETEPHYTDSLEKSRQLYLKACDIAKTANNLDLQADLLVRKKLINSYLDTRVKLFSLWIDLAKQGDDATGTKKLKLDSLNLELEKKINEIEHLD